MSTSPADSPSVFQGQERLELLAPVGRAMGQGSPAELSVSDVDRVRQAIASRDAEAAREYLALLKPLYQGMLLIYTEWAYAWTHTLAAHGAGIDERAATAEARAVW